MSNQTPNRVSFAEIQRQLKEATGGLDADVSKIRPIKLRREWVICMTRIAAQMANTIWASQEEGNPETAFFFTIEKFPDVPVFGLGDTLRVRIDLVGIDTPALWSDCEWQPPK